MEILFGMIVILIAGFIQGLTSFGLSIVAIPFLARIIPLQEIVPTIIVLAMITNALVLINSRKEIQFRQFTLLVLMGVLFLPVGVFSLTYLNPNYLKLFFGVLITGFSLLLVLKKTFPIKHEKIGYVITGALSGFLNGSLSLSGPPVVLFLSIQGVNKDTFRANITLYFMILNIIATGIFLANGLMNRIVIDRILYFAPALVVGVVGGIVASKKLKDEAFKKLVLVSLLLLGVWTTISTFINLVR
ncbi:MAG: sulfite exporter TauE/SafE family protein [Treponema sp.]|nr:sulfite exporter TauE/SafE family protein [Treponema sp.]